MSVPSGKHCRATRTGYLTLSNQNLAKHITEVIQKQRNKEKIINQPDSDLLLFQVVADGEVPVA